MQQGYDTNLYGRRTHCNSKTVSDKEWLRWRDELMSHINETLWRNSLDLSKFSLSCWTSLPWLDTLSRCHAADLVEKLLLFALHLVCSTTKTAFTISFEPEDGRSKEQRS
jgi:hypothetical protein